MFKFENQLVKLKHDVLTSIVKVAKEKEVTKEELEKIPYQIIPGEEPSYRESVKRERSILLDRAKLAAGFLPNGADSDELVNVEEEKQILYVIKEACDMCPTKKFQVTDACRNCIAHKCQSVCNFGAITYVDGRAYIDPDKCKECGMCKKACPYDAIAEDMRPCKKSCPTGALDINSDKRAMIKEEKCVNCGACMAACPFGAIEDKSSLVRVVKQLTNEEKVYAVVAPAIAGQFGPKTTYGQVRNAIKALGFTDMVEAACGADAVTVHESNEFVERMENGDAYMTNSCCPGFLSYIEKMMSDQVERISGTVSPMVATARYIKATDKDAKVIFIGPCTAKKTEALIDSIKDAVDYVLTFEELMALFDGFDINPETCDDILVDEASIFGRGFGVSGGLTSAIENYVKDKQIEIDFKPVKVSGGAEIKKTMTMAKLGRLQGNFIEGMMCEGGCINGAGKFVSVMKAKATFTKINHQASMKTVLSNEKIKEYEDINLER
ncbi:4Fe-4S dicluster domain-containing protein [Clostridium weizhouense]|uniref:4Fe-4S dicluster domain-containing protein n=1 Tax=Clostridium weizhouense TaxID=2859781 RepID=A0ABS7AP98_9CLOT|nr:4Fe-4S dicluster domain-containing protein [Clostridium weizhouense]MBW6410499.1 4Fe-4S dicluster domain-containing protein [Clostridium weizhouense]